MDPAKTSRHLISPYWIILAAGLLAHGMLLLNDGKYMEGWFLEHLIRLGKWEEVKNYWIIHGYPVNYWLQSIFGQASLLRGLSFIWILLTALFQYKILIRFSPLTAKQSLFVTVFALVWPFYHLLVWRIYATGMIFPILFYGGWYTYLCLKEKKSHFIFYIFSLTLIFLSFNNPVFLTFNCAFVAIYGLSTMGYSIRFQTTEFKEKLSVFLKQNWVLTLLPFVFYLLKNIFFPVSIPYNQIKLFSLTTAFSILKNIVRLLIEPILSFAYSIPTFGFVLIPVLLVASIFLFKYFKSDPEPEDQRYALGMIAVGLILIVTLSITYGLVWKTFKLMSWKSSFAFSGNLGFGLFFLGSIHWLYDKYWNRKKNMAQPTLLLAFAVMILVNINLYSMWQARWAHTASIIHNLKQKKPIENASIYFLNDDVSLGADPTVYATDFTLMLIEAWNQHQYIGITSHYQGQQTRAEAAHRIIGGWKDQTLHFHSLVDQFDPNGCFAEVVVSPKNYHPETLIGFKYIFIRLFKADQMNQFLSDLTEVQLRPLKINAYNQLCS